MEVDNTTPKVKQPTFGNIPLDSGARSKRANQKFFDSAEWAMQQEYLRKNGQLPNTKGNQSKIPCSQIDYAVLENNNSTQSPIVV